MLFFQIFLSDFMYSKVLECIDNIIKTFYLAMEEYMEYIFNAPSTINRIIKYYSYGFSFDKPNERYIMFNGIIVKVFYFNIPQVIL